MKSMSRSREDERPLVDVEVEIEAHLQQQAALDDARRHVGRADGAEQQRVEASPLVDDLVGQHRAVAQVAGAAEVVVDGVEVDAGGAHDLQRLGDDLGTDAVAADDSDACGSHVLRKPRNRPPRWTVDERTRRVRVRYRMMTTDSTADWTVPDIADQCTARSGRQRVGPLRPPRTQVGIARGTAASGRPLASASWPRRIICPRRPTTGCTTELQDLTTRGRVDIARKIEAARELGDLSENGDYHAAKEEQGKMEARIRHLDALLKDAEIVEGGGSEVVVDRARSSRSATRATTTPSAT